MNRHRLLVLISVLVVVVVAVVAWPRLTVPTEPLFVGGLALPGKVVRYDPERVTGTDAKPVHPGPRADAIEVGASWDAAMLTIGGEDFVDVEERHRRELRHADLALVQGPADPGKHHPTFERRFSGLIELRLRGEDYAIGSGSSVIDGQVGENMVTSFVRRPQGWMVTEDLAGTQVMRVVEAVRQPASPTDTTAPDAATAPAYDPDLVERPWPTATAELLAECHQLFADGHWLSRVALNRLCSPTHLPGLEAALSGPHAVTAARVLLSMNVGEALAALMRSSATIPEEAREPVRTVFNTTYVDAAMLAHMRRYIDDPADRHLLGAVTGALARCGTKADLEGLVERARTGTFDEAQIEAFGTGLMYLRADAEYVSTLEALVTWWGDPRVTGVALQHLAVLGGAEAMLAALVQANLADRPGQGEVLAMILETLMPNVVAKAPDTPSILLPHLTHETPSVRWLAAEMLAACRDDASIAAVTRRAKEEPVEPLRQRMQDLGAAPATP